MTFKAPAPPYVGPAAHVMHDDNGKPWTNNTSPLNRIVMHGTVSACVRGGARAVANDFRTTSETKSAHYVVDPGEAVQVVYDREVAEHAPPNPNSIGVELCDPETGSAARWHDKDHEAMLQLAAPLVAALCLAYDVPVKKIGPRELLAGERGICGHRDVSQAWHQTDHTDPIGFPWKHFMALVEAEVEALKAAPTERKRPAKKAPAKRPAKKAAPKPAPAPKPHVETRAERAVENLDNSKIKPRAGHRLADRIRAVFHLGRKHR